MLSNPFPNKGQQIVVGTSQEPPQGGNQTPPHQETSMSKKSNIYAVAIEDVSIQRREKNYEQEKESKSKELVVSETQPLQIPTTKYSI